MLVSDEVDRDLLDGVLALLPTLAVRPNLQSYEVLDPNALHIIFQSSEHAEKLVVVIASLLPTIGVDTVENGPPKGVQSVALWKAPQY